MQRVAPTSTADELRRAVREAAGAGQHLVVADDALEDATFTIAEELAHGPTVAHAATKRLVHIAVNEGILAADEAMAEIQKPIWASEDLKIGLASFRENGPGLAKFTGR